MTKCLVLVYSLVLNFYSLMSDILLVIRWEREDPTPMWCWTTSVQCNQYTNYDP